MTVVTESGSADGRKVHIQSGEGVLELSETEARQVHERIGILVHAWDKEAVLAFMKKRPRYIMEHVIGIAQESGVEGIPFCKTCADWHHPSEDHSSDDGDGPTR